MKCDWQGCDAEATHNPKIMVPATGHAIDTHQPLSAMFTLKCCLEHCKQFDVQGFLNQPSPKGHHTNKIIFEMLARGRTAPDFERAFVQPVPMDSDEAKTFQKTLDATNGPDKSVPPRE